MGQATLGFYNTKADIDAIVQSLRRLTATRWHQTARSPRRPGNPDSESGMESTPRSPNPIVAIRPRAPWLPQAGGQNRLPVFLTSFVGRDDEIALATVLLERPDVRLLTLTGPGGIGKTRLAVEIAAASAPQFPDGVAFVPLASIQDPATVMMAVAAALDLHELDSGTIDDGVASALGASNSLLVIDNFEHVMDAAPAVTRLLARCPNLTIMVTSRSLIRVEGEHSLPVPPLGLPRSNATMARDDWLRVPVVKLFIERAGAVDPSLAWDTRDISRLVEICRRLDGLPLAIELAATRIRHFSLAEVNDRLNGLLPLLIDGSRDHPSRLQTMRNAIAWSYDLLSPESRELLRLASVFRGGFSLEAIGDVLRSLEDRSSNQESRAPGYRSGGVDGLEPIEDRLARLIDASLLIRDAESSAGVTRYRMLETIREFAWEKLEVHGEMERARRAQATHFTNFAVRREISELIPEHVEFMDELLAEQDNLRSALAWLMQSPDRELFQRLVAALGRFWLAQSNYHEARAWFERALASPPVRASAEAARIQVALGMTEIFQEDSEAAEAHLEQGLTACREQGEAHSAAQALIGLSGLAVARGDPGRSTLLLKEAQQAVATMTDARLAGIMSGWVSINLAVAARAAGDAEAAERYIEDALARFRAEAFPIGTMMALGDLGDLALDRGDWTRALALYKEALAAGRADQAKRIVIEIIESVAIVAVHLDLLERGATLLGAADGLRDRIGLRFRQARHRWSLQTAIDATRRGLPTEAFTAAWDAGRTLSVSQATAQVLALDAGASGSRQFSLTGRENEILQLLATGMTDPEIADILFISVRTVEHHVANLCRKLGVRTRTAATSTAMAAGLVPAGGA